MKSSTSRVSDSVTADRTPVRPLPQATLVSRGFWASGADGVLSILRCPSCAAYTHPPTARCRVCHGGDLAYEPVSGEAVVVGFTINHQQWLADFPPPYVVAVVALAEDPAVRLTTNVVNCDPEAVRIGMPVRVVFEKAGDVHLPLFEPDPARPDSTDPVPEPLDAATKAPAMLTARKFEDQVALTGVGQSRVGRRLMVDPIELAVEAAEAAVADAGLTMADIDGISTYPGRTGTPGMSEGGVTPLVEALGLQPTWINGAGDTNGQAGAIIAGMLAVSAGLCRHVLCVRTVWEASYAAMVRDGSWEPSTGRATHMLEERAPYGAMSAANWIGIHASQYFHRYAADRSLLGSIAVVTREHASRNPEAVYRDPLTLDDYYNARIVTTPFGLYDCDVPVDGAVGVVVSAVEAAGDRLQPPVLVEAVGTQIAERLSWDQGTLTHEPQTWGPARHLWTRTTLRPADVDVALLYDGFTFNAVSWLEALGFCGPGEATDFLDGGRAIGLDGVLPLNPHGGQLSAGRLHGFGHVREAMLQLRRQAGERQVADADIAVVTTGGGAPGGALLLRRS